MPAPAKHWFFMALAFTVLQPILDITAGGYQYQDVGIPTVYKSGNLTMVNMLHNLLEIPLQFTITGVQYANYTFAQKALAATPGMSTAFALPEEMATRAIAGSSSQRLVIQTWTGALFISNTTALFMLVVFGIWQILRLPEPVPIMSGITEIDMLNLARRIEVHKLARFKGNSGEQEHLILAEFTGVINAASSLDIVRKLREVRVLHRKLVTGGEETWPPFAGTLSLATRTVIKTVALLNKPKI
ncbi:hypothetical protein B0H63DRAFT_506779 [Podospora didyma]|uniref:Uncharacterized protein n=1 Tax=Podospora didyma TaxID=330526 RepID=A0AAE0P8J0_9PEZI|nr:hypothetical protein B0H63DRAFT_506779 [Podospora didyma]